MIKPAERGRNLWAKRVFNRRDGRVWAGAPCVQARRFSVRFTRYSGTLQGMIRIVRPFQLLTVLMLLLSGLLQPLSAARGLTCAREEGPADVAQQVHASNVTSTASSGILPPAAAVDGDHDPHESQPDHPRTPSAPCGTAAIPEERVTPSPAAAACQIVVRGDQLPASPLTTSLFRPPRLS
jgi:hypothetical protein